MSIRELDLGVKKGKAGTPVTRVLSPSGGNQGSLGWPHPTTLHCSHILRNPLPSSSSLSVAMAEFLVGPCSMICLSCCSEDIAFRKVSARVEAPQGILVALASDLGLYLVWG